MKEPYFNVLATKIVVFIYTNSKAVFRFPHTISKEIKHVENEFRKIYKQGGEDARVKQGQEKGK